MRGFGLMNPSNLSSGGRTRGTCVTKQSLRDRSARLRRELSNSPEAPENGTPVWSSVLPGLSPQMMIPASRGPLCTNRIWPLIYSDEVSHPPPHVPVFVRQFTEHFVWPLSTPAA